MKALFDLANKNLSNREHLCSCIKDKYATILLGIVYLLHALADNDAFCAFGKRNYARCLLAFCDCPLPQVQEAGIVMVQNYAQLGLQLEGEGYASDLRVRVLRLCAKSKKAYLFVVQSSPNPSLNHSFTSTSTNTSSESNTTPPVFPGSNRRPTLVSSNHTSTDTSRLPNTDSNVKFDKKSDVKSNMNSNAKSNAKSNTNALDSVRSQNGSQVVVDVARESVSVAVEKDSLLPGGEDSHSDTSDDLIAHPGHDRLTLDDERGISRMFLQIERVFYLTTLLYQTTEFVTVIERHYSTLFKEFNAAVANLVSFVGERERRDV